MLKEKTGVSGVYTSPKPNLDGLYPNFAHNSPASKIAELSDVSHPTINQLLFKSGIAFGILERHGKVHTEIVSNAAKKPYRPQSGARWPLTASSTRTAGGATMG